MKDEKSEQDLDAENKDISSLFQKKLSQEKNYHASSKGFSEVNCVTTNKIKIPDQGWTPLRTWA